MNKRTITIEGGQFLVERRPSAGGEWAIFDQGFDTRDEAEEFIKTQNPIGFDYSVIDSEEMIPHAKYIGPVGKA